MITEAGPLNLRSGPAGLTCKIHPSVLVTICDSYIRRPSGARRVIGTLLGYAIEDSVYVKACYTEISEEDEAQVRREHLHTSMDTGLVTVSNQHLHMRRWR